jgi:hypothetical protein
LQINPKTYNEDGTQAKGVKEHGVSEKVELRDNLGSTFHVHGNQQKSRFFLRMAPYRG